MDYYLEFYLYQGLRDVFKIGDTFALEAFLEINKLIVRRFLLKRPFQTYF